MKTASVQAAMTPLLQPYIDRGEIAGVLTAVADKDRLLSLDAVGYADLETRAPMRADTLMWIASQTKPFAGVLMMMLIEEGKVSLDDAVAKHLPEFSDPWMIAYSDGTHRLMKKPARAITVRDVMNHTSGLNFSSPLETPTLDRLSLPLRVGSYAMTALLSEPGTRYLYSNMGINTGGRIIEVVTGKPFEKVLDERIIGPMGLTDTTFVPSAAQLKRLATSYRPTADLSGLEPFHITQLSYPLDDPSRQPIPAGGLFSSITDCVRFCQMLMNGGIIDGRRYISESSVKTMTSRQTAADAGESYGVACKCTPTSFGHSGAMSTNMTVHMDAGIITIFHLQHVRLAGEGPNCQPEFVKAAREKFGKLRDAKPQDKLHS